MAILNSPFFGVILTLVVFKLGVYIAEKTQHAIFNPLLTSSIIIMVLLKSFNIPLKYYMSGGLFISFFLAPATVILIVPLFEKLELLKKYSVPILIGGVVGSITAIASVIILCRILGINEKLLLSFIPKSITTPIGIELSRMLGGVPSITVFAIIITGITGNVTAPFVYEVCGVRHPIAKGVGLGMASHVVGTVRACCMGEVEGAMSALSVVIAGVLTLIIAPLMHHFFV